MTILITGNFPQLREAQRVLSELEGSGFSVDQTTRFRVHPVQPAALGQDAVVPARPTVDAERTVKEPDQAGAGALTGGIAGSAVGVAVGVATLPLLGPGAALAATAIGAYAGSLYGALNRLEERDHHPAETAPAGRENARPTRPAGMRVAVLANESSEQDAAIRILRRHGATDIERLEGLISAGEWTDVSPRQRLQQASEARH